MVDNLPTVVVGMSGGVDSSVAAALLTQNGYNVVGVTLLFRPCDDDGTANWCCGMGAQDQARGVAEKLGIRHYSIDCAKPFEQEVLRPAWEQYARGRTPSPCVICNREVKFRHMLDLVHKLGGEKVATGHYARILQDKEAGKPVMLRGKDSSKDQSYFLFSLSRQQMESVLFPLGHYLKTEVRELAREMGFSNADRKESQDACFVHPEEGFAEGLRRKFDASASPGRIVDQEGKHLGEHHGIHRYTIGQRKGLGIALGQRAYVSNIDAKNSEVVLTTRVGDILSDYFSVSQVAWVGGPQPLFPLRCQVQIRYQHRPAEAMIESAQAGKVNVRFEEPQSAVTPGQAAVFFDNDRVLGGGWID